MKGSIHQRANGQWYVAWYHAGKQHKIYKYNGEPIENKRVAEKLKSAMQHDMEHGTFRIETYIIDKWTDTVQYLTDWLEAIRPTVSPSTSMNYGLYIKKHLSPFFSKNQIKLKEIQYDVLVQLMNSMKLGGRSKLCVMKCLAACLQHAWLSGRIQYMPPFPDFKMYQIVRPEIQWIPEDRQMKIIDAIPKEDQPIFLWLKYHLRRPAEAMALLKTDYDPETKSFCIHRSVSARQHVDRTKTGKVHIIPCHSEFAPMIKECVRTFDPYFFTRKSKPYTMNIIWRLWQAALAKTGETITLYAGLKHSSCSQYINGGMALSDLQAITDHGSIDSVKQYAKMELDRKRQLMERKPNVIPIRRTG